LSRLAAGGGGWAAGGGQARGQADYFLKTHDPETIPVIMQAAAPAADLSGYILKTPAAGHRPHPNNLQMLHVIVARLCAVRLLLSLKSRACHLCRARDSAGTSCIVEMVSAGKCTWCRWGSRRGKPKQLHQVEFTAEFSASLQRKQEGKQAERKEKADKNA